MKNYVELEIEGKTVALSNDKLPFLLSFRVSDEIGEAAGSSADRFIDIPASKTSNNLYGYYNEEGVQNKTAIEFKDTTVKSNGVPIFKGVSQLQRAVLSGRNRPYKREVSTYKVGLYGQNSDWLIKLRGLLLSDLEFADQVFDSATVQAGWDAGYDNGDYFGFCPIKWKSWNNEDISTTTRSSVSIELGEFTPFLFVRSIVEGVFDAIGFNLSSDLLDAKRFKSLILPLPPIDTYPQTYSDDYLNITLLLPPSTITAQPIPASENVLLGLTALKTPPENITAWDGGTSTYTVLNDGFFILDVDLEVTATTGAPPQNVVIAISINSGGALGVALLGNVNALSPPLFVGEQCKYTSNVIQVSAGDTIQILEISVEDGSSGTADVYGTLKFTFEATFGYGQPIVWKYLLQDWTALDFVNGLSDIHNLKFEEDTTRRSLRFEPRNKYTDTVQGATPTLNSGFYVDNAPTDLTNKLDFQKDAERERLNPKKQQVYKWVTDGDTEQAIEDGQKNGIYDAIYNLQDNTFLDEQEVKEVRFFAKTVQTRDILIQSDPEAVGGDIAPLIPLIFPQNYQTDRVAEESKTGFKPRILHFLGQRDGIDGYMQVDGVGDIPVPATFFVNYNDSTGLDPSLSFASEVVAGNTILGLLDTYYIHQMVTLSNAKRLKEWVLWDSLMLSNLSFRTVVLLDGVSFILDEIQDFDPTIDDTTQTILLPNVLAKVEDSNNITNSELSGLVARFE